MFYLCCFLFVQELEKKVDFWMEKYEKDVESKQHELDVLKASKAKDLEKLQELTKLVCIFTFQLNVIDCPEIMIRVNEECYVSVSTVYNYQKCSR